jgi:predicted aldo/keto reductase-like oxidoreductase
MWTKPYGRTGKNVSVIGFGGMRFHHPENVDSCAELVLYAHGRGINYFDTAPYYCEDKSEEIMGAAFKLMPRQSFYCSSKCGSPDGGEFRSSLERSLKRLCVEKIDFFHIWCLVHPHEWEARKKGGAVAEALKAKEQGLIGHVVASAHLNGADTCRVIDEGVIEGLTIGYNALNFPFRSEALDGAARANIGVVTMNPLGGGMIPNNADRLGFLRGPGDSSVVEAALRFNISHPAITSALVGFGTQRQVDEAVAAVEGFQPYPSEHVEQIKANILSSFDDFCTGCGYCVPCPSHVPIPKLMESFNGSMLGGGDESILSRLSDHWDIGPDAATECTQCGQCEQRCTQHLPIRERLKHIGSLKK